MLCAILTTVLHGKRGAQEHMLCPAIPPWCGPASSMSIQLPLSDPTTPLLQDTVQILRGLSEKYSSYHGVRIHDRALVMAAVLADRYITARFLPDKAIDVVDEACSNLRVQLESMPEQLDAMLRQQYRLQVEEAALAKEKDPVSCRPDQELSSILISHIFAVCVHLQRCVADAAESTCMRLQSIPCCSAVCACVIEGNSPAAGASL